MEAVGLFQVRISNVNMTEALAKIASFIESRTPRLVVTPDATAIVRAQKDLEFREIINRADLVTPDGAGIIWAAKLLNLPIRERVAGIDLMSRLCQLAAERNYEIYLLGALPGIAEEAGKNLSARFPGLKIAGTYHGYFTESEEPKIVKQIKDAQPDILFVALGMPKQEKWIKRHLKELKVPVSIGVGGSFDVISGRIKRAPRWIRAFGLEWLYRLLLQPRRMRRTLLVFKFIWMALKCKLRAMKNPTLSF